MPKPHLSSLSVAYEHYAGNIEVNGRMVTFWKKDGAWEVVENGAELLRLRGLSSVLSVINRIVDWLLANPSHTSTNP